VSEQASEWVKKFLKRRCLLDYRYRQQFLKDLEFFFNVIISKYSFSIFKISFLSRLLHFNWYLNLKSIENATFQQKLFCYFFSPAASSGI
jgi:hypothetical protein